MTASGRPRNPRIPESLWLLIQVGLRRGGAGRGQDCCHLPGRSSVLSITRMWCEPAAASLNLLGPCCPQACWNPDPVARPDMSEVAAQLQVAAREWDWQHRGLGPPPPSASAHASVTMEPRAAVGAAADGAALRKGPQGSVCGRVLGSERQPQWVGLAAGRDLPQQRPHPGRCCVVC